MPDENFLTASQLKEVEVSGKGKVLVSADSGHPVEWVEEQNYIFRLSAFQSDLIHWLRTNGNCILLFVVFLYYLRYDASEIRFIIKQADILVICKQSETLTN